MLLPQHTTAGRHWEGLAEEKEREKGLTFIKQRKGFLELLDLTVGKLGHCVTHCYDPLLRFLILILLIRLISSQPHPAIEL